MTVRDDLSPDIPLSAHEFRETGASDTVAPSGERPAGLHGHVGICKLGWTEEPPRHQAPGFRCGWRRGSFVER
jgi:hypothetical protein